MDQVYVVRHKVLVEGRSAKQVAAELGISRNTVRGYVEGAELSRKPVTRPAPVLKAVRPRIGDFAVVGDDVVLGDGVVLHPHVVIAPGVVLESNVEVFPGAFIGKEPKGAGATARIPEFERTVRIGKNCSVGPHSVIFYDVEIGEGTLLGDGASTREQGRVGSRCIISRYVTLNYNVRVGHRTKVMDLTHLTGNCTVGDDVFVSVHVSTVNDNTLRAEGYSADRIVGPTLEDGCAIGANAVLLPNIRIGARAVVAAGAVITADVAPGDRVFGIPARSRKGSATK